MPSPPSVAAVRCKLDYLNADNFLAGSRFYLTYSGSPPTAANCNTLAGDIGTAWASHIAAYITNTWTLNEIDVLDLGSTSGASAVFAATAAGTASPPAPPSSVAVNVEFDIARRYRGGKPRMYFPQSTNANLANNSQWSGSFVTTFNSAVSAFFAQLNALSIGSMGTLQHSNISFFHGVDKNQPPTGTWRGPPHPYPPAYRTTPLVDVVENYSTKATVGSQKRRRTATTP